MPAKKWEPSHDDRGDWQISRTRLFQRRVQDNSEGIYARHYFNVGHSNFIASFNAKILDTLDAPKGEVKFIFSDADQSESFRVDFMYETSACRITTGKWQYMSVLQLTANQRYRIRIAVKDNAISVEVDGLPIIQNFNFGKRSDGIVGFGTWCAATVFSDIEISALRKKRCFVIMPFDEKRDFLYEYVIKPTLDLHPEFDFDYERADEALTVGRISEEICEFIKEADIIIADITENNRNVFYELGYAHACEKKAILLIQPGESEKLDIPFDIQDFRCHKYDFSHDGFGDIGRRLPSLLSSILREENQSESP